MSNGQKLSTSLDEVFLIKDNVNLIGQQKVNEKYLWVLRLLTPFLFAGTLFANYSLGINKNKQVSNRFYLWVTPPGYFFAIWGIIYTGLISMVIYNLLKNVWSVKTHIWFGVSNILNILWTIVFVQGSLKAVVFASFILIIFTFAIFKTWVEMGNIPSKKITILTYIMRNIWAFYLGWCIAASNLNFGIDIVYWWGKSYKTQMIIFWIMAPLCAVGGFTYNYFKYGKYGAFSCFCLWFSVAWAFIGAAITSNKCLSGKC